jgi:protein-disulfide isomerase
MSTLRPAVGERDHVQGSRDAAIELVEYGDYECPYCGEAYAVVKALQRTFSADLLFAFRNFPLTQAHPHAFRAACAAEAAALQDAFWPMHDLLYENQAFLEDEHLLDYAKRCELDLEGFARDLDSQAVTERVRSDFLSGARSGVNGTPTFFVNGQRYDGSWQPDVFLAFLSELRTGRELR